MFYRSFIITFTIIYYNIYNIRGKEKNLSILHSFEDSLYERERERIKKIIGSKASYKEYLNPSSIGGGGGFHHHLSVFLIAQKEIKITCSFFLTFNKIDLGIFCQKFQGPRTYLGLSTAFFVTWPWKYKNKKCNFRGVKSDFRTKFTLAFLILIQKYTFPPIFTPLCLKMTS